jgi:hypothetical protein
MAQTGASTPQDNSQIDLSAGFVPKQPAAASTNVDLSAGLTPKIAAPTGPTIGPSPKSSDIPEFGYPGQTPAERLSMPIVKLLIPIHEVLEKATSLTPQGRAEHPIMAKVGELADNIQELLTGGQSAGKPMGTTSGFLNNPVTAALSAGPGIVEAAPEAVEALSAGAKNASNAFEEGASGLNRVVNPFRRVEAADESFAARPMTSSGNAAAGTQAVKNVAGGATEAAGVTPTTSASLRDVWNEPIASREAVAKGYYKQLDAASDNQWTANQTALQNVRREIQMKGGLSEDVDNALNARKTRLEWQQDQILDKLPPGTAEAAKANWVQKSRLEDIQDIFNKKSNVSGVHPDLVAPELQGKLPPEKYNFKGIAKDLNAMDPTELTTALGKEGAQKLVGAVNLAAKEGWATGKAMAAIRFALSAAGFGAIGHFI